MAKIVPQPARVVVKVFKSWGFQEQRQTGSHLVMTKPGVARPVIIPIHPYPVSAGVIESNLRTAGKTRKDWNAALSRI